MAKTNILKRFADDKRGSAYVMAALSIVPLFGMMALAIDYTNHDRMRTELETASETVALHSAKQIALNPNMDIDEFKVETTKLFKTLVGLGEDAPNPFEQFSLDPISGKVQIVAKMDVKTHFMHMFGHETLIARTKTEARFGRQNIEVAIAIDNSGSMDWDAAGNRRGEGSSPHIARMDTAKKAVQTLIEASSASISTQENATLLFSITPWNTKARVADADMGGAAQDADWIDWDGRSIGHFTHLPPYDNNGDPYFDMPKKETDWHNDSSDEWVSYDPNLLDDHLPLTANGKGVDLAALEAKPGINIFTRRDLYDRFTNSEARFRGCFDHRAGDYKFSFAAPNISFGNSLYVPHFAPDEYDWTVGSDDQVTVRNSSGTGYTSWYKYRNDYISDIGGVSDWRPDSNSFSHDLDYLDVSSKHGSLEDSDIIRARVYNTPKYVGSPSAANDENHNWGERVGPSADCVVPPILGLESDVTGVFDREGYENIDDAPNSVLGPIAQAIKGLEAAGGTDLSTGLSWAMNTLTPHEPFAGAGDFGQTTQKIMVFMTDGDNSSGPFEGEYALSASAHGYMLDNPTDDDTWGDKPTLTQANAMLDEASIAMCESIRARGVRLYFIYFGANQSAQAANVMNRCSSTPETAIHAANDAELTAAFQQIGNDIGRLRLTHYTE